jgi:hypothetical protein
MQLPAPPDERLALISPAAVARARREWLEEISAAMTAEWDFTPLSQSFRHIRTLTMTSYHADFETGWVTIRAQFAGDPPMETVYRIPESRMLAHYQAQPHRPWWRKLRRRG